MLELSRYSDVRTDFDLHRTAYLEKQSKHRTFSLFFFAFPVFFQNRLGGGPGPPGGRHLGSFEISDDGPSQIFVERRWAACTGFAGGTKAQSPPDRPRGRPGAATRVLLFDVDTVHPRAIFDSTASTPAIVFFTKSFWP